MAAFLSVHSFQQAMADPALNAVASDDDAYVGDEVAAAGVGFVVLGLIVVVFLFLSLLFQRWYKNAS